MNKEQLKKIADDTLFKNTSGNEFMSGKEKEYYNKGVMELADKLGLELDK